MARKLSGAGIFAVCLLGGCASFVLHMIERRLGLETITALLTADPAAWRSVPPGASFAERFIASGGPLRSLILGSMFLQQALQSLMPAAFGLWLLNTVLPKFGWDSRNGFLLGGLALGVAFAIAALALGWISRWPAAALLIAVSGIAALLYRMIAGDPPVTEMPVERVRAVRLRDTRT